VGVCGGVGLCGPHAVTEGLSGVQGARFPSPLPAVCLPCSLLQRKELWRRQTEEQLRNLPDPDTPPGHAMMPEGQRLETLGNLKQSKRKRTGDSSPEKQPDDPRWD